MANELKVDWPTPSLGTICFVVTTPPGQAWNNTGSPAFEAATDAHVASYAIAATYTALGVYAATMPAGIPAGTIVTIRAFLKAGSNLAVTDTRIGGPADYLWDGTQLIPNVNASQFVGAPIGDGFTVTNPGATTCQLNVGDTARKATSQVGGYLVLLDASGNFVAATSAITNSVTTSGPTQGQQTFASWVPGQPATGTYYYALKSPSPSTAAVDVNAVAAAILINPSHKLATDMTGAVNYSPGQILATPRSLDNVADNALTFNDALWSAIVEAAGRETVSGQSYSKKTPAGTVTLRGFTLTLDTNSLPTARS